MVYRHTLIHFYVYISTASLVLLREKQDDTTRLTRSIDLARSYTRGRSRCLLYLTEQLH